MIFGSADVTVAAILKSEDSFIEEWIAYHRLLGVDRFILYDHDPRLPLAAILSRHSAYVTIIDWSDGGCSRVGRNPQTRAYEHAVSVSRTEWIAFLDGDEFLVLRNHRCLADFLAVFDDADCILLNWHLFGHNGFYDDPPGLVTELLTRRRLQPGRQTKCVARRRSIISVSNAHGCSVARPEKILDANHMHYTAELYPGKTQVAHINHYICRSFVNWMARVDRGQVAYPGSGFRAEDAWKHSEAACLRRFVEITRDINEYVDEYVVQFSSQIRKYLMEIS